MFKIFIAKQSLNKEILQSQSGFGLMRISEILNRVQSLKVFSIFQLQYLIYILGEYNIEISNQIVFQFRAIALYSLTNFCQKLLYLRPQINVLQFRIYCAEILKTKIYPFKQIDIAVIKLQIQYFYFFQGRKQLCRKVSCSGIHLQRDFLNL
ncbi:unnamed protein product (macronuclear) [Paramecium tetraurelia]|uniref:Transmembrane protein n=1 Tax=Paramecium tetraurelia TaxID=5888 RepID=A0E737_PARTE|nr:uncharacterized protein GSPATT00023832001 [Paramecium tetraurelia]CAK91104.1 unnamed protein product [Paramecium tetraurelia]|eukprot:XP_001458501.1 hypothetical protein (macronuclear) [Paramecium tetraurelia strain d4-2]